MAKEIYICEGTCAGQVEAAFYFKGKNKCADPKCNKYGKPLTKYVVCDKCFVKYKPDEKHVCKKK